MPTDAATLFGARVLVTGASRGLGAAIARALAGHRAHLVLTATDAGRLTIVARDCRALGATVDVVSLDLGDAPSVDAAATEIAGFVPWLEGIVMNAAILGARGPVATIAPDEMGHAMAVNVTGPLRLLHHLNPMIARGAGVVVITSGAAAQAGRGAYGLTKGMLDVAAGMLRDELRDREIRVVRVNPGPVRTAMRAAAHPGEDPATVPPPSERVASIIAVLAGDDPGPVVQAGEWGLA